MAELRSAALPAADRTALVLLVPESEPLVSWFRSRHDPSAAQGMPAHITIFYPFVPAAAVTTEVTVRLDDLLGPVPPFDFRLAATGRFPGVLYMPPEPAHPVLDLTRVVHGAFPECTPYGGAFEEPVPHLTVAQAESADQLDRVEQGVLRRLQCTWHEYTC